MRVCVRRIFLRTKNVFLRTRKNTCLFEITLYFVDGIEYSFDAMYLPSILWVDLQLEGSKGKPVILCGPFGINKTVNLNCATNSPSEKILHY